MTYTPEIRAQALAECYAKSKQYLKMQQMLEVILKGKGK